MHNMTGNKILLRALEPDDLQLLYQVENDQSIWEVSGTINPYSKFVLKQYLDNAHRDIYEVKQLRLVIERVDDNFAVGLIDLYDFDPRHKRAGLGIVIFEKEERRKGYAGEAIQLLSQYCFDHLDMHQVYACIGADNAGSQVLFEKNGFVRTGTRQDWLLRSDGYQDELFYQLIRNVH
ncbi:GNAT family N-acetyltransferase [Aureitalea marina]|uniref:GNAT family N-acetyltransferase n=1 Tax=Aureitalea marina TaxID=930804 RepID=A0A2S7KN32_9FLAO|nr:GNAT family N-acetyltransferase [Aureitalea marina]PQB04008.1 GNAT family N-acetyltransferase [Aureitalea marina]